MSEGLKHSVGAIVLLVIWAAIGLSLAVAPARLIGILGFGGVNIPVKLVGLYRVLGIGSAIAAVYLLMICTGVLR